ncbi:hypothetical protein L1F30_11820 [Simiduia sp. 21SJ11W-1]|uniref:hypothetical protein n=1 Tax=Simiduia sp. 21SJ11W-1 TaxID=2909669 RepID=UPI0020A1EBB6|nr:hypothetical protein [Simiduia sp. 21SJ11W-1]UTA46848.1 hypothetical protein L1F30_11820 [Simiduia sp. 21SJ11W-1]
MSRSELDKIAAEINAHPTERQYFDNVNLTNLVGEERAQAIELLLDNVEEGAEWLLEFTENLLGDDWRRFLEGRLERLERSEHGYIYISYMLYRFTGEDNYIERMKDGIFYGDRSWDMRRSALGRVLKRILSPMNYAIFCAKLLEVETSRQVIKTALLGVCNYLYSRDQKNLPEEFEIIRKMLLLDSDVERASALNRIHGLMKTKKA